MYNFKNAYSEVYEILKYLDEKDKLKIPKDIIQAICENRNKEYTFEVDEEKSLKDQNLLPEARAILFNLFRDYLASPRQKDIIVKMQRDEIIRNEIRKKENYKNAQ